jgi:hypothetical protein
MVSVEKGRVGRQWIPGGRQRWQIPGGARMGDDAECGGKFRGGGGEHGGRCGMRRSGRMTAVEDEDTTMAADRGRKKWLSAGGGASLFYIYTPFSPRSCNQS